MKKLLLLMSMALCYSSLSYADGDDDDWDHRGYYQTPQINNYCPQQLEVDNYYP